MKVTVTQGNNVATFTWNDSVDECDYTAIGFSDEEVDSIIEAKAHQGKDFEGYEVDIAWE